MWPSLVKIQYTELKLCGNDPVVRNSIYSNGDHDLWPNDPKINRVLPLPQGNHVTKFGKDLIYRTKIIVRMPARPNHIIRPVSRRAYKKLLCGNLCGRLSATPNHIIRPVSKRAYKNVIQKLQGTCNIRSLNSYSQMAHLEKLLIFNMILA